jgi:putative aldouronate transport system permease protein
MVASSKKIYRISRNIMKSRNLYLMLIPVFIGFAFFHFIPIIIAVIIGFLDYDLYSGLFASPWVGIKYFIQFVNDPFFGRTIKNTVLLGGYTLLWGFWPPILLAILLEEIKNKVFKRITQSITYLPYFLSTVIIIGIMYGMCRKGEIIYSVVNLLFAHNGESINIISNPQAFRTLYIVSNLWQFVGWGSIIYIAAISGIDSQLYEAAIVDGANRLQRIWHITICGIVPTIVVLFILQVGQIINVGFEKVIVMYSPATYETSDIIQTYIYRRGLQGLDFGYAGAVNLFNAVVSLILVIGTNMLSKKLSEQSLW